MKEITHLPEPLRELAQKHFVLLESQNRKKKLDTIQLNLSGYADVMYLMADIVKVCMLALEGETSSKRIPEPNTNISGVLGIVLDLIPYEEADLLDLLRDAALNEYKEEFIKENFFVMMPMKMLEEMASYNLSKD